MDYYTSPKIARSSPGFGASILWKITSFWKRFLQFVEYEVIKLRTGFERFGLFPTRNN